MTQKRSSQTGRLHDRRPAFIRYVGIDYSGAETPTSSLKGLRVYEAGVDRSTPPIEVPPPPSPRRYWTRRGIAEWLDATLSEGPPVIVGIDHGFSFPLAYFRAHGLPHDWPAFLEDFQRHWPTDGDHVYVDFVRDGMLGTGALREGKRRWRRLTERRSGSAKSVFHFDVQGSVAKSTHSGLPWLLYLRRRLGERVHFWPFDGWMVPQGRSAIVEVYPRLCSWRLPREDRSGDQHDAYSVASWLRDADLDGDLARLFAPPLTNDERATASIEGWILGVECDTAALVERFTRIQTKGTATVLEIATMMWRGPHESVLRWRPAQSWSAPPTSVQLAAAQARAIENSCFFRTCQRCGCRVNRGYMHDTRTCMVCAEKWLGVIH